MQIANILEVVQATARRHAELGRLLSGLSDTDLSASSLLPGWSRLTIACHLRFGAETSQQMTRATLNGDDAAYYPQGRSEQRPSTLVLRGRERPGEVVDSLIGASSELDVLWHELSVKQWAFGLREPADNSDLGAITLGMLALLRLTEVEVHGHDLDIGCVPWSGVFVETALPMRVRWLATRRSNHASVDHAVEGKWILRPTDGTSFSISASDAGVVISEGSEVDGDTEISGSKRDLLGFLLGRIRLSALSVRGDHKLAESFLAAFPGP